MPTESHEIAIFGAERTTIPTPRTHLLHIASRLAIKECDIPDDYDMYRASIQIEMANELLDKIDQDSLDKICEGMREVVPDIVEPWAEECIHWQGVELGRKIALVAKTLPQPIVAAFSAGIADLFDEDLDITAYGPTSIIPENRQADERNGWTSLDRLSMVNEIQSKGDTIAFAAESHAGDEAIQMIQQADTCLIVNPQRDLLKALQNGQLPGCLGLLFSELEAPYQIRAELLSTGGMQERMNLSPDMDGNSRDADKLIQLLKESAELKAAQDSWSQAH